MIQIIVHVYQMNRYNAALCEQQRNDLKSDMFLHIMR